jgi:hypothetical protein
MMDSEVRCDCVVKNRNESESQREWMKRCMCMHHWMQTDYFLAKLKREQSDKEWKEKNR